MLQRAAPRKPKNWLVDKGGEFQNRDLYDYMRVKDIDFYSTQSPDTKAAIAVRVICTLKSKVYRYLTHENTWRYIEKLPAVVKSYNSSIHRSIGMAPEDVTKADIASIKQKLYPSRSNVKINFAFTVGDKVRLARLRAIFQKGHQAGWTEEIFTISECLPRIPPVYRVADAPCETVERVFYTQELLRFHNQRVIRNMWSNRFWTSVHRIIARNIWSSGEDIRHPWPPGSLAKTSKYFSWRGTLSIFTPSCISHASRTWFAKSYARV